MKEYPRRLTLCGVALVVATFLPAIAHAKKGTQPGSSQTDNDDTFNCTKDGLCNPMCNKDPDCPSKPQRSGYSISKGLKHQKDFHTKEEPNLKRQFDWTVPTAFADCKPKNNCAPNSFPLIVVLHGYGGGAEEARKSIISYNLLHKKSSDPTDPGLHGYEKKPVFFMYPDGLKDDDGRQAWTIPGLGDDPDPEDGPVCRCVTFAIDDKNSYNDVEFISEAVDDLLSNPSYKGLIDPDRIFMMGFSNGAQLALMNLCLKSAKYQGFAAIGGTINSKMRSACGNPDYIKGMPGSDAYGPFSKIGRTRSVLTINGTEDFYSPKYSVDATTNLLLNLNGIVSPPILTHKAFTETPDSFPEEQTWGAASVRHYTIVNGDHSIPDLNRPDKQEPKPKPQEPTPKPKACVLSELGQCKLDNNGSIINNGSRCHLDSSPKCSHNTDFSAVSAIWDYWNQTAGLRVP